MESVIDKVNTKDKDNNRSLAWTLTGYLLDALLVFLIALSAWVGKQMFSMENRLATLDANQVTAAETLRGVQESQIVLSSEITALQNWRAEATASRFSAEDGREVWREIAQIRENMAGMGRPDPPAWLVERVDGLERRLYRIENNRGRD